MNNRERLIAVIKHAEDKLSEVNDCDYEEFIADVILSEFPEIKIDNIREKN